MKKWAVDLCNNEMKCPLPAVRKLQIFKWLVPFCSNYDDKLMQNCTLLKYLPLIKEQDKRTVKRVQDYSAFYMWSEWNISSLSNTQEASDSSVPAESAAAAGTVDTSEKKKSLFTYYDARDFESYLEVDIIEYRVREIPVIPEPCQAVELVHMDFLMSEVPSLWNERLLRKFVVLEPPRLEEIPRKKRFTFSVSYRRMREKHIVEFNAWYDGKLEAESLKRRIYEVTAAITPMLAARSGLEFVQQYLHEEVQSLSKFDDSEENECVPALLQLAQGMQPLGGFNPFVTATGLPKIIELPLEEVSSEAETIESGVDSDSIVCASVDSNELALPQIIHV